MLYQLDQTGGDAPAVFRDFWVGQQQAGDELRAFAEQLVLGVIDRREEADRMIVEAAENWRIERMAVVDRNVLRLAVYELTMSGCDTPAAVVLDEAIEIAKKFGGEGSGTFVNGVLDSIRLRYKEPRGG